MTVRIQIRPGYLDAIKKLPPDRRKAANAALAKFMKEPSLPSLKFRPLVSSSGYFIISSAHGDRIILHKQDDEGADTLYWAVDVGPHDNVYRRWNRLRD